MDTRAMPFHPIPRFQYTQSIRSRSHNWTENDQVGRETAPTRHADFPTNTCTDIQTPETEHTASKVRNHASYSQRRRSIIASNQWCATSRQIQFLLPQARFTIIKSIIVQKQPEGALSGVTTFEPDRKGRPSVTAANWNAVTSKSTKNEEKCTHVLLFPHSRKRTSTKTSTNKGSARKGASRSVSETGQWVLSTRILGRMNLLRLQDTTLALPAKNSLGQEEKTMHDTTRRKYDETDCCKAQ